MYFINSQKKKREARGGGGTCPYPGCGYKKELNLFHVCLFSGAEDSDTEYYLLYPVGESERSFSCNDWLALSQMEHLLEPFKDANDVLCTHTTSLK